MIPDPRPLASLAELVSREASGELICASDTLEIHVYFQRGRLAWATDAARPFAFTRRLLEVAQIDVEMFREILEACRREKRPLGETLIGWGAATREEVRDALRHQIDLAIGVLRDAGPVQTLFLNRPSQFADYDVELTFRLDELLLAEPPRADVPVPAAPLATSAPLDKDRLLLASSRLRESVEGTVWIELLEGTSVASSWPEAVMRSRVPAAFARGTLLDGAELVAMKTTTGTLGGVALSPAQSLWCLAPLEATVGGLVATLASLVPADVSPRGGKGPAEGRWIEPPGASTDALAMDVLREFRDRAPEVLAALVTDAAGVDATYGAGRDAEDAAAISAMIALVDRRARALAEATDVDGAVAPPDVDADGLSSCRVMMAERGFVLFAAQALNGGRRRFVWIALERSCSKGIGWGYLTSLSRQLVRLWRLESV